MGISIIDLKVFAPKYRQALLYAMIEGLKEGSSFSFSDDRDPNEVELELVSARLNGYRWARANGSSTGDLAYLIERHPKIEAAENRCGCCCAQAKEQS